MSIKSYKSEKFPSCEFVSDNEQMRLKKLFGFFCGANGNGKSSDWLPRWSDFFDISSGALKYDDKNMSLVKSEFNEKDILLLWRSAKTGLEFESRWYFFPEYGLWERHDSVKNGGPAEITLTRCFSRFVFSFGRYEIYKQDSFWSNENQGIWVDLSRGGVSLFGKRGRSNEGNAPYLALREKDSPGMLAFHLVPCGNWKIKVSQINNGQSQPYCVVDSGISDENLAYRLAPGETFEMPDLIIQNILEDEPHYGAPMLQRHLLAKGFGTANRKMPIVYNTWFDRFQTLEIEYLRKTLEAAKEIGAEIFVVDAGWFGDQESAGWFDSVGDWREKSAGAFYGKMRDFAEEVRSAGLGFGLWMEPERVTRNAPILKEHPEWFVAVDQNNYRVDFLKKEACDYIFEEISALVDRYGLVFIKIDMNQEQGVDESGRELHDHTAAWFAVVDRVKEKYPQLFIEHCSGGGMRTDLNVLKHFDSMFPTDNANPLIELKITQGLLMRSIPGRISHWIIMRESMEKLPGADKGISYIGSKNALWNDFEKVDPEFAILSKFCGYPGLSTAVSGFGKETLAITKFYIDFFKARRTFFLNSVSHLLTRPYSIDEKESWIAIQLQSMDRRENLILVYNRPYNGQTRKYLYLRDLEKSLKYKVVMHSFNGCNEYSASGEDLMKDGLCASIYADQHGPYKACLYSVTAE